ncbi:MAG: hypothetical protein GYA36_18410, partial [Veillonellaceae bacterium]|nr:hypothetical protein [Veillonellaceae bacterium]
GKPLNKYLLNIVNQITGKKYKSLFNVPLNEIEAAFRAKQIQLLGEVPLNTTPDPTGKSLALSEIASTHIYPLLDSMQEMYKAELPNHKVLKLSDIPEQYQADIRKYIEQVKGDMASTKLVSQKWGEEMRDTTLLNYNKRTGFDEFLSYFFPYSFWYTHSMMNWASRMVQKPAIIALYYRYREMQKRMERDGIPQRLKGKIRIPAAYLPDWMGGGYWIDPMKQLFPFAQFTDPYNSQVQQANSLKYETYKVLSDMVDQDLITEEEATLAKENQSGDIWEQAYAQAVNESDLSDPISLASMMMTPAMYLTVPYYLAKGTPEKISPTPLLKSSQAVKTALQETPFEAIGNLVGTLGEPERLIRKGMGLTEGTALFGEYGDYYVDRQLANMVADGEASLDDAERAMINRTGDTYLQAVNRVKQEVSLKVPGILPIMAAKGGATAPEVASALFFGLFPGGLLPEGELEYLELKDEYNAAWEKYKLGDKQALTEFYDKYPVFQARSALNDEPEDRMRNFLVGDIWDRYMALDSINRGEVANQLGQEFEDRFLNKETRDMDSISLETLAKWAMALGSAPLQTEEFQDVENNTTLDLWNSDTAAAYTAYQEERNAMFPNWYAVQQNYYNLPKNKRGAYLKSHPELSEYWTWKREYIANNPVIQPILASQSAENDIPSTQKGGLTQEELAQMPEELYPQLMSYFMLGTDLGPGAWTYLYYLWENAGQPYGDLNDWIENEFKPSLMGN